MAKQKNAIKKQRPWVPFAYLSPALLTIAIFSLGPVIYTIYLSFTNFNLNHFDAFQFVGFDNYKEILFGPFLKVFLPVFFWTVLYALLSTGVGYLIGLVLAILLNNERMKESNVYRAILVIPWALPAAIAILAWQGLYNESFGQINLLLSKFGIDKVQWLSDPYWAKFAVVLTTVWLGYPFMMNVCLGALQSIPKDLYEAADIDGAGRWKKFTSVTLPGLTSSTLPLLISSFAFNFNNFGAAFLITGGGPPRTDTQFAGHTDILVSSAYSMTLTFNRYDLASALSLIIFLIVGTLSFVNMKFTKAFEEVD
ncbi:carbohydrate ABC transporter permease [Tumebacillus permanentifrigoris]|uniref:Maltose/maltodextrin transport system permease protein n=1 Tax=Tumebacillus permanentifrigoris TaxID=378543 RepID=A0A316D5Y2_9BACL|nr:sugar ABC transporter permease [Tumebacillus permanentifrigoris]PWK06001.1 carbohydrate ABC transporter membrane protein 1 (CUT1 family) [Tumebacillus permanentifrigoris]